MYNQLTGDKDTDLYLLYQLDDEKLNDVCQTNLYYKNLCYDDKYLRQRIYNYINTINKIKDRVNSIIVSAQYENYTISMYYDDEDLTNYLPLELFTISNNLIVKQSVHFNVNNYINIVKYIAYDGKNETSNE